MMRVERKDEYYCEKHNFRSTDPRKVLRHAEGDLVDAVMDLVIDLAGKTIKRRMGLDP